LAVALITGAGTGARLTPSTETLGYLLLLLHGGTTKALVTRSKPLPAGGMNKAGDLSARYERCPISVGYPSFAIETQVQLHVWVARPDVSIDHLEGDVH
jgi:hypothetical protein